MQACVLSAMNRWVELAAELNIQNWSLKAGSLMGLVCYEGMVPWDDDIDIAVFGDDCNKLETFFHGLSQDCAQADARYECHSLDTEFDLFHQKALISIFVHFSTLTRPITFYTKFKLRSRLQPFWGDILGLDIDCYSMPEETINASIVQDTRFGPSSARILRFIDMSILTGTIMVTCLS